MNDETRIISTPKHSRVINKLATLFILTAFFFIALALPGLAKFDEPQTLLTANNAPAIPVSPEWQALQLTTTSPQTDTATTGGGGVVLNEVELVDTIVEWFAWGWICFGIGLLLLALLFIPFLQIRGSHLKRKDEE